MVFLTAILFALTGDICPDATRRCEDFVRQARCAYATKGFADYKTSLVTQDVFVCKGKLKPQYAQPAAGTVRWMHVEGSANFRDIGGWTGLRTGLVYRGAEANCKTNPADFAKGQTASHDLFATERGLRTLSDEMRIRTDLDLRAAKESPTPDASPIPGACLCRIPLSAYTNGLVRGQARLAKALRVFADRDSYPIYFHCYGGADRTGTLALVLEGLCGVREADINVDYELTSFGLGRRTRYDGPYAFAAAVAELKKRPGATFKEKVDRYVRYDLGLSEAEVASIRKILTGSENGL